MKHTPRCAWCDLHRPVSTTTDRGFVARMCSAASKLFVMWLTPNRCTLAMPSSKGLRIVPGSLSTTSTKATVLWATRPVPARRGLWRSRNRAGARARVPRAPTDRADDIASRFTQRVDRREE